MERLTIRIFHCRALKRDLAARCPVPPLSFPTDRYVDRAMFADESLIFKATSTVAFKHAAEDDPFIRLLRAVLSGKEPASRADVGPEMALLEMKAVGKIGGLDRPDHPLEYTPIQKAARKRSAPAPEPQDKRKRDELGQIEQVDSLCCPDAPCIDGLDVEITTQFALFTFF